LRMSMIFLNAFTFNTPEIFIGLAQNKFEGGALKDETTRKFITQQLEGFAKFVERVKA
jgi:chromate reductase, NAD(P)H dehydrogenase (quinone)